MFGSSGSAYAPSYSSLTVNGQLVPVLQWQPLRSGNAVGPAFGGGPASPATVPPNASTGSPAASAAASSPFNVKTSGLVILLVMLVGSVLWLRYIHWG